jgi:hypothetical protein
VCFSHAQEGHGIFFHCFLLATLEEWLRVIRKKILKIDIKNTGRDGVHWFHLAQDRNKWRTVVNYGNEPSDPSRCE